MAKSEVRESTSDIADQIEAAIREQEEGRREIEDALDERAHEMKAYAESISPVYVGHPRHDRVPGRYKASFELSSGERDGMPTRSLGNTDEIANLVEYGSVHNPEHAVLARTAEEFGGTHHRGE
jgi:hypothetical protein